jgi:hypothetical protein
MQRSVKVFYRWVRRLESMQMPSTSFPAAGGDPAVESEETHQLDAALVAAALASLWVVMQSLRAGWGTDISLERAVVTYGPIFLVGILAALLVRPETTFASIVAHITGYGGIALLMGLFWTSSGRDLWIESVVAEVAVWSGFFALVGLVTSVLCVVVWATAVRLLATPRSALNSYGSQFRFLCVLVILVAALIGPYRLLAMPLAGQ